MVSRPLQSGVAEIAREAGRATMTYYGDTEAAGVREKADQSPVTLADEAAHQILVDGLRQLDPETPVVSEESAAEGYDARQSWRRFWLVDPLDGTKEFIKRRAEFTVNVALIEEGEPVLGVEVEYIDGDALREVFPATGFTREEREEHLRRTGYMASRLAAHGVTVVASFVSPYRASREFIRRLCPGFLEIFVATPLDECERRDVKGLYARARRGEIRNFTGIDDPYEPPEQPELTLDTRALSVDQCVDRVLDRLGGDR